MDVKNQQ